MADIALIFDPVHGDFDIGVANGDLIMDDGLLTAVILSCFCDRQAEDDDALPDDGIPQPGQANLLSRDRRGWWGDWYMPGTIAAATPGTAAAPVDRLGSRDWLLKREKQLASVMARGIESWQQALQWMVDRGVASTITVTGDMSRRDWLSRQVVIKRPDGTQETHRFDYAWANPTGPALIVTSTPPAS